MRLINNNYFSNVYITQYIVFQATVLDLVVEAFVSAYVCKSELVSNNTNILWHPCTPSPNWKPRTRNRDVMTDYVSYFMNNEHLNFFSLKSFVLY